MARIATIIGRDVSGNLLSLGVADGAELQPLVEKYKTMGGILKQGKNEVRLSEIRLLCSGVAGGELKARRIFK